MRLTLKKLLRPFQTLREAAEAMNLTVPELKRKLDSGKGDKTLSLDVPTGMASPDLMEEDTFKLFHRAGRCLVCGNLMHPLARQDIGWGEFKQCRSCQFSVHDLANYETRKKAAVELLSSMITQSQRAEEVLQTRFEHSLVLKEGRSF